jgi:hypothetical protein
MIASCEGVANKENVLAQGGHDRILHRVALFLPL